MRRLGAVVSIISAGIFCLMLSHAVYAAAGEEANKQLVEAVLNNDMEAVQKSVGDGADPSASNEKGLSAIDIAVDKGFFDIAHYLLAVGNSANQNAAESPGPSPSPVGQEKPAPSPSISVQSAPLGTQADDAAQLKNRQTSTARVSAPPIDRELVAEAPEPITVLPVVPSVQPPLGPEKPEITEGTDRDDRLIADIRDDKNEPGFIDQITNLFSPFNPSGTDVEAKTGSQAVKPIKPTIDPAQTPVSDPGSVETNPIQDAAKITSPEEPPVTIIDKIGDLFSSKKTEPEPPKSTALDELETLDSTLIDEPLKPSVPSKPLENSKETAGEGSIIDNERIIAPKQKATTAPKTSAAATASAPLVSVPDRGRSETASEEDSAQNQIEVPIPVDNIKSDSGKDALLSLGDASQVAKSSQPLESINKDTTQKPEPPHPAEGDAASLKSTEQSQESISLFDSIGNFFSPDKPDQPEPKPSSLDELEAFDETQVKSPEALASSEPPNSKRSAEPRPIEAEPVTRQTPDSDLSANSSNSVNPFTRLTDLILDILPESKKLEEGPSTQTQETSRERDTPLTEKTFVQKQPESTPEPEKIEFPVEDLTVRDDPYKVIPAPAPVSTDGPKLISQDETPTETAALLPVDSRPAPETADEETTIQKRLAESDLIFGEAGRINSQMPGDVSNKINCVIKKAWNSHFCIQAFKWPAHIRDAFGAPMFFQGGGQSIVHYVAGRSVQYHGLFPTSSFNQIASFLVSKYGAPSERPELWATMLAEAKRRNQTYRWIAPGQGGGRDLVLEIREIDDLRWSAPPDKNNGVIRLYQKGDESIFRLLTTADLLLMQVRKGNDPPSPPEVTYN